jgi:hypothetical protein
MLLDTARRAGYHGAIFWSVLADDDASDFESAKTALTHALARRSGNSSNV